MQAVEVTSVNAGSLNPYTFTITFADNVAVAAASLSGSVVQVLPPGAAAPITATVSSVVDVGGANASGDARSVIVTYEITPPGGSWSSADAGIYTITLGGSPVTDLAGNAVAPGTIGTFTVLNVVATPTVVVGSTLPGSTYGQSVSFTVVVSGSGPTATGTVQFLIDGKDFGSPVSLSAGDATSASTVQLGAGSHAIEADYSGDSNYVASDGTYTQLVNPAPLSIVADNLSRPVGQANPNLTYSVHGLRQRRHGGVSRHHRVGRSDDLGHDEQSGWHVPDHGD